METTGPFSQPDNALTQIGPSTSGASKATAQAMDRQLLWPSNELDMLVVAMEDMEGNSLDRISDCGKKKAAGRIVRPAAYRDLERMGSSQPPTLSG
jgi:hypothetical protein